MTPSKCPKCERIFASDLALQAELVLHVARYGAASAEAELNERYEERHAEHGAVTEVTHTEYIHSRTTERPRVEAIRERLELFDQLMREGWVSANVPEFMFDFVAVGRWFTALTSIETKGKLAHAIWSEMSPPDWNTAVKYAEAVLRALTEDTQ